MHSVLLKRGRMSGSHVAVDKASEGQQLLQNGVAMFLTLLDLLRHRLVLLKQGGLTLLELFERLLVLLLALGLHLPPEPLVLALDRPRSFHGHGARLHVVVDERVLFVVENVVLVLENDLHGGQDVECVIDAPLHVLELDSVAELLI